MINSRELYYNFLLLNSLNESTQLGVLAPTKFFTHKNCGGRLNSFQLLKLNEAYAKFTKLESLLSETYNRHGSDRIQAWNKFILFEDRATPNKGYLLQEFLGAAAKWVHKKLGGKSRLYKGGSFMGLGSKSREQQAEYGSMKETQKELMDVIEKSVSADYPNNDDVKQFEKETQAVLDNADKFIKNSPIEIRADMYKTLKKWVVYQLDQKVSSYYQDHMESKRHRLPRLDEAEKKEGEPSGKEGGKQDEKKKASSALDDSETVKQLQSKVLPKFLKILAGAGALVTAGTLATHPEILTPTTYQAIQTGDTAKVATEVDKVVPPAQMTLTKRFGNDLNSEYFSGLKSQGLDIPGDPGKNPQDLLKFYTETGNGDPVKGASSWFSQVKIDNPGSQNAAYVVDRLKSGKSIDDAFAMPGSKGGFMERMGGAAGLPVAVKVGSWVSKVLMVKNVSTSLTTLLASGGILSAPAWAPFAAAAGVAVAAGGLLSSWLIKSRRDRSLTKSRLAFLNGLRDKIDELEKTPSTEPPPAEPPPGEPAPSTTPPPDESDIEDKEDKPRKCTDDEIKQKVLDYLKTTKSIDPDKHEVIANILTKEFANDDFQPKSVEDLAKSIPSMPRLKKLRPATAAAIANAVADCFDFSGEADIEDKEEARPLSDEEIEGIVDKVSLDIFQGYSHGAGRVMDRKYLNKNSPVASSKQLKPMLSQLVKALSVKGKITPEYDKGKNPNDYRIPDFSTMSDSKRKKAKTKADNEFISKIDPAQMERALELMSDPDVKKIVGNFELPLYMLGGRKALLEMLAIILKRGGNILAERFRIRNDKLILERWQKMAGVLNG